MENQNHSPLAARFAGPQSIAVQPQEWPEAAAGEVTLNLRACGICGTDLHFYSGRWPQPTVTPGHEMVGVVAAVGEGVENWKVGQRACVEPLLPCGHCRFCQTNEANRCQEFRFIAVHRDGGFASSVTVPVWSLHPLPDTLSDDVAALIEPLAVAVHVARAGGIQMGDTVAICGAGSIGLLCIAAAKDVGAGKVIISARHPQQVEAARRLGAEPVAPETLETSVQELTGGIGADVVLETVGGPGQAVGQAISAVRAGGTVVLAGGFTRPTSIHLARVVNREIRLVGSNCYSRSGSPTDFEKAIQLADARSADIRPLITHQFPLARIDEAFKAAWDKSSGAIKVQVQCS